MNINTDETENQLLFCFITIDSAKVIAWLTVVTKRQMKFIAPSKQKD